ncbi:MAG: heparan-alpha-glucosaminide N-acetyltransferase domain-containing protein [Candidatus Binatia bacterium]
MPTARAAAAIAYDDDQPHPPERRRVRNGAIDCLRGVVMILMALDHTRSFLGSTVDLAHADAAHFFTRWVTHFCAPVFVLLAGTGAWLHGRRLGSTAELSRWLASRGLWLIVVELTFVRAAWIFYLGPDVVILQVIWAIGASMVVLAALVWVPFPVLATAAIATIAGHNLLDGVRADDLGGLRGLWLLLHQEGPVTPFAGAHWFVIYPLIPWFAVMAAGYVLGPWVILPPEVRRRRFFTLGTALIVGFVLLRASGLYGDPHPWEPARGVLGFLDCEKYPPSLLFLAMTLGPALVLLALLDRPLGVWGERVTIFGRVPLFYYVLHILLIHVIAVALAWPTMGSAALARQYMPNAPLEYAVPLVYAFWVAVVVLLYPPSRWFAGVKQRSNAAWLSYL